jgi:hypothetical protein
MMIKLCNILSHLFSCLTIYKILIVERLQQKYVSGIDPIIYKPDLRGDLSSYVNSLREEFDYSNNFRKKKGFYSILFMRRLRVDHRLANWMNKIWLSEHLEKIGVPTLNKFYTSYNHPPSNKSLNNLTNYVAKPAHMSEGDSVFVISNDIDLKSGDKVNSKLIINRLTNAMSSRTVSWDSWATRNTKPGVVVEEMSLDKDGKLNSMPDEIKIYCVWGKVYFGVWRRHLIYQNGGFLYREHFKDNLKSTDKSWWKSMIEIAEIVALGTDFIRVDMFINGGNPVVNEVEIMPTTPIPYALQTEIANLLNTGYEYHRLNL